MKVLIFCPTYEVGKGHLAVYQETLDSIKAIIAPEGVTVDVKISNNNPYKVVGTPKLDHENTLHQYRLARQIFLEGDWDALWFIEHDMIIPEDALIKMLPTKADVVYGLYLFRHVTPILNCLRAVKSDFADMTVSWFPQLRNKGYKQGWLECSGAGFGCTLIHRHVLEKIDFRRADTGHPAPDMPFASDCQKNGFKQVCRFDVLCGHIKPDGTVLWPSMMEGGDIMNAPSVKILVYRSFNANIEGRTVHFEEGEKSEMPGVYLDDFVRAGFIGVIPEKPAVKVVRKPSTRSKKAVK